MSTSVIAIRLIAESSQALGLELCTHAGSQKISGSTEGKNTTNYSNYFAMLTCLLQCDWGQQKQASIFLKLYKWFSQPNQLVKIKKKIRYENKPQGQQKRKRKRPSGDSLLLLTPLDEKVYLKKHTWKSTVLSSCSGFEWQTAKLQWRLKERKNNMKKAILKKRGKKKGAEIWQPYICHLEDVETKHQSWSTALERKTATHHQSNHERLKTWWNQRGCTLEKLWAV